MASSFSSPRPIFVASRLLFTCHKDYRRRPQARITDSGSTNAVNFSSGRTTKRFPSSRCASATKIVRRENPRLQGSPTPTGPAQIVGDCFPVHESGKSTKSGCNRSGQQQAVRSKAAADHENVANAGVNPSGGQTARGSETGNVPYCPQRAFGVQQFRQCCSGSLHLLRCVGLTEPYATSLNLDMSYIFLGIRYGSPYLLLVLAKEDPSGAV